MTADAWPFVLWYLIPLAGFSAALIGKILYRRAHRDRVVYKSRADWLRDIYADVSLEVIHARILRSGGVSILKKEFEDDDAGVDGAVTLGALFTSLASIGMSTVGPSILGAAWHRKIQ